MSTSFSAGLIAGNRASFSTHPHNRDVGITMAAFEVFVDKSPVLTSFGGYGRSSNTLNTMCFNESGLIIQRQYLNGEIEPEKSRRFAAAPSPIASSMPMQ